MNEQQWFACTNPKAMLDHVGRETLGNKVLWDWVLACRYRADPDKYLWGANEIYDRVEEWSQSCEINGLATAMRAALLRDVAGNPFQPIFDLRVGDTVTSADASNPLHCGSGRYNHAVVVSLEPFALASE